MSTLAWLFTVVVLAVAPDKTPRPVYAEAVLITVPDAKKQCEEFEKLAHESFATADQVITRCVETKLEIPPPAPKPGERNT